MPDIELRFHRDMLVLSAPIDAVLERQGVNPARDRQYLSALEPDIIRDALRMELMAGAQCLVTPTEDITRARLAHVNMDGDADRLAQIALGMAAELKPQHVLVEIGPCGLPLDASSKSSLNENRGQYADAARSFGEGSFDAFFLNGFTSIADLKCALMGVAQVSGKPVFASVTLGASEKPAERASSNSTHPENNGSKDKVLQAIEESYPFPTGGFELVDEAPAPPSPTARRSALDPALWPEVIDVMADLGVAVVGFETADPLAKALEYAQTAVARTQLPVLTQLIAKAPNADGVAHKGLTPLDDIDEYTPDTMERTAVKLFAAGVQFLRATGAATPAFTGALAATVTGLDVRR